MRRIALAAAAATLLATLPAAPASASAPPLPPSCTGATLPIGNSSPATVSGGPFAPPVTSTITVAGAQPHLRDLDLVTDISHSHSDDLDVRLTSPQGTVVTITTDNGGASDNVFGNGTLATRWDDDASQPVTEAILVNGVPNGSLIPEEAMAAFVGENPNGVWTLSVGDDSAPDNGTLNRWSLELATASGAPTVQTTQVSGPGSQTIMNIGLVSQSASVAGAGTYLGSVRLHTDITHEASGDLAISLRSPSGTTTQIATEEAESFDDVYGDGAATAAETLWSDVAGDAMSDPGGGPVTDAEFADDVVETDLVPEGAMGAFTGENPNGSWTLDVNDLFIATVGDDGGTLNTWSLEVETISNCAAAPANNPPVADAGGPYTIIEGGSLALDASGSSDPDAGDTLTYTWDVNGDGTFGDASGVNPTLTWAQLVALGVDDSGSRSVVVRVLDGTDATTSAPAALTINNVEPSLAITGPPTAVAEQPASFAFDAQDVAPADQAGTFSYAIDWDGNGSVDQVAAGDSSTEVAHAYPSAGSFTIRATAADKDGGVSAAATKAVTVSPAPPASPGPGAGRCSNPIGGTRRGETLTGTGLGDRIRGRAGNDRLRGLGGDDCLSAGRGRDRLAGGAGDDLLRAAGGGRDVLRCGPGADVAVLGPGDRSAGCETRRVRGPSR